MPRVDRPRGALSILSGLVAAAALAGCTPRADSSPPGRSEPTPRRGGSFHIMFEAPGTLDPSLVDDVYEACIVNQLHEGLVELDANLDPVPGIAREWTVSRDGREYVFRLRDDVRFHDGRPLGAEDVVYSYTRLFDPGRGDPGLGGEYLRRIVGVEAYAAGRARRIEGLVAEDISTVRIRLEAPYASFLAALAMDQTKIVDRASIERDGGARPNGTGPFVWVAFEDDPADPRIVLAANEDWHGPRAWLDELVFHVPPDYTVERGADALLAGRVSVCDLPPDRADEIAADPRFRILRRPELSFSFLGFGLGHEPWGDARLRRAVAHAVDRERLRAVDPTGRVPAGGILPPGMFGYSPDPKVLAHDPERARALLAEAGYPGGERLPPLVLWQADRGETGRAADALLRENLAAVGIRVEHRYAAWETFSEDVDGLGLPAFGLTWVADVPDPDSFLTSLFHSDGAYNMFRFSDPLVDSLLDEGAAMRSSRRRAELYQRAERRVLDEAPVVPLFHIANTFAVRAEVRALAVTPFGYGNLAFERVWLASPAG